MITSIRLNSSCPFRRTTGYVLPQFRAGFTLSGLVSRSAPCSENISCCTVCHVSCTIQVGIQSIFAALAMDRVPVSNRSDSKSEPRASAAVERRECRGECDRRKAFSEGFILNKILKLFEIPLMDSAVLSLSSSDFVANVFQIFNGNARVIKTLGKVDQFAGNLMVQIIHVVRFASFGVFDHFKRFSSTQGPSQIAKELSLSARSFAVNKESLQYFTAKSSCLRHKEIVDPDINADKSFYSRNIRPVDFFRKHYMQVDVVVSEHSFRKIRRLLPELFQHKLVPGKFKMDPAVESQKANPGRTLKPLDRHTVSVVADPGIPVKVRECGSPLMTVHFENLIAFKRFNSFISGTLGKLSRQLKIGAHKTIGFLMQDILIAGSRLLADLQSVIAGRTAALGRSTKQPDFASGWVFDFVTESLYSDHNLIIAQVGQRYKVPEGQLEARLLPTLTDGVSAAKN